MSSATKCACPGSLGGVGPMNNQISAPRTPGGFAFEFGDDSSRQLIVCCKRWEVSTWATVPSQTGLSPATVATADSKDGTARSAEAMPATQERMNPSMEALNPSTEPAHAPDEGTKA